jgi:NADPH2:quinone reductase
MQIIEATAFGGPDVLVPREVPDPVPGPGEVVVRVAAADTLFVDTQIRAGDAAGYFGITPPYLPGGGVSGEVIAVGDGVADRVGQRVVAWTGAAGGHGGYAEQAVVAADCVVPVPDGLELVTAAALVHDGVTALRLVETTALARGDRVLVVGATGAMGLLLVQLAAAGGAHVVAAARGRAKLDLARTRGAELTVDYSAPGWAQRVRAATGGRGVDVVLDGVGGDIGRAAFDDAVAAGGRFSAHGAPTGEFARIGPGEAERRGVRLQGIADLQLDVPARVRLAGRALAEAAAGGLVPVIGTTFPLARAADAHAAIEARAVVGKILLVP